MFNISLFLNKFSKNIKDNSYLKGLIIEVIKNKTKIILSEGDLEIKNGTVFFIGTPGIKNKIFINKEKILLEINKNHKIIDIK